MQSHIVDIIAANRQFDWLERSLMYDTSDQYTTIYDSYKAELAAKKIDHSKVENITITYSTTNDLKFNLTGVCASV